MIKEYLEAVLDQARYDIIADNEPWKNGLKVV